jgi:hypothetical protein
MSIDIQNPTYSNLNKYAVLSSSGITSANTTTIMNGYSYGSSPIASYTGSIIGIENSGDATTAQTDLTDIVNAVAAHVSTLISAPIPSSSTFYPDLNYNSGAITFSGTTITLDALGDPNAYFFIKSGSAIIFNNVPFIILKNGASTCNIFWIADTSIGFTGTNPPSIPGIFIAGSSITFANGANVNGRLYAQNGNVTFIGTTSVNAECQKDVVCYAKGTLILTDKGFIPIEHITRKNNIITKGKIINNDFINERDFKVKRIRWINKFKVHSLNKKSRPICIKTNALGPNLPFQDLYVSPQHGIFINGNLFRAKTLINNDTIFQDNECTEVEYYHVECNHHSAILANGILSESYLEIGNNRRVFETNKKINKRI